MAVQQSKWWRGVRTGALVSAAALVLSQCAAASDTEKIVPEPQACTEEQAGPTQPTDDSKPIFIAENHSYLSNADEEFLARPYLVIYADGTVAGGEAAKTKPGRPQNLDPLPPLSGGWIDPCTLDWLTDELSAIGEADYGSILSVEDGGYSTFVIDNASGGEPLEVTVDQFGLESDEGSDPDLTAEQYEARMHLHEAIRTAQDAINDREFLPDRVRVVKIDGFDDSESSVPWPGLAELSECEIMTGAEAESGRDRLREAASERLVLDEYYLPHLTVPEYFIDPDATGSEVTRVAGVQVAPAVGQCGSF